MDNERIIRAIWAKIKESPSEVGAYEDMFAMCRNIEPENFGRAHELNEELRRKVSFAVKKQWNVRGFFELYKKTLLFDAPHYFDAYMLYLEIDREPSARFYQPRRRILKRVVDALQKLVDDELDELFISCPPRIGKTTLLSFFITWVMGRNSEKSNLYSAYSDTITSAFYNAVSEILTDPDTYLWNDVFPEAKIVQTNAKDEILNIDRRKHYPSLTCRSIYGTLNGACDCDGILIADDLVSGIEEALNVERLKSLWNKVDNNFLTRVKDEKSGVKKLWIGTRWSLVDPIGIRRELLESEDSYKNVRYEVIDLPALDENDESNFDYDYNVGFSTEFYHRRRASFEKNNDLASWDAGYMQRPIERSGTLFAPEDLRFYNGELPDAEPDRVFMAVDPAFGGGDFTASPVCVQYGDDIYVHDVVYNNEDKRITQPLIVKMIEKYNVAASRIELNKSTETYKDGLESMLKEKGIRINLTSKAAPNNKAKDQRIFDKAPDIRDMMIFRESGKRSKEYELFMQNVFSFKVFGKNQHDDAPDSLAMAVDMVLSPSRKVEVFKRTF
jgi:predicted phage terminase large subunit-like protein